MRQYFLPIVLLAFTLMLFMTARTAKKQRIEMEQARQEALVEGNWVRTRGGFYGQIVEIDGDVVVLATPAGDETIWHSSAILLAEEPPFAATVEPNDATTEAIEGAQVTEDEHDNGDPDALGVDAETK